MIYFGEISHITKELLPPHLVVEAVPYESCIIETLLLHIFRRFLLYAM